MPIEIRRSPYGLPPLRIAERGGVRAGADNPTGTGTPPHAGDFYHTPQDRLDYINWLDGRVALLLQAYLGWLDGGGKGPLPDPPSPYGQATEAELISGKAVLWNEAFGGGMPFDRWVSDVWRPFKARVNEGSPNTNWTLLNTHWPDIQERHKLIAAAAENATRGQLPNVPYMGDPNADDSYWGNLNKPGGGIDMTADLLKAGGLVLLGLAGILLVKEMKT
jgi:hypothetical protein